MRGMAFRKNVVFVFTLKTVLTSIRYLLYLTLQGKETNFRGHRLAQTKVQRCVVQIEVRYQE
jgi:hypothetical protein